jgi:hypothetical protein
MTVAPRLHNGGDFCIRMLLLPRLQARRLADAKYVLFWESEPRPLLTEVRRRGGTLETFKPRYGLARLP